MESNYKVALCKKIIAIGGEGSRANNVMYRYTSDAVLFTSSTMTWMNKHV